jgi:hypothetical protein
VKFALGSSLAEAKANAMALNDQELGRTHYAHMAFEEVFGSHYRTAVMSLRD